MADSNPLNENEGSQSLRKGNQKCVEVIVDKIWGNYKKAVASIIAHTFRNFMEGRMNLLEHKKELIFSMINFIEYETCTILKHIVIIAPTIDIIKHAFVGIIIFDQNKILDHTMAIYKCNKLDWRF